MECDNSVQTLLQILEPLVLDLDNQKKCLIDSKNELESVSRFLAYTKDKLETVGVYADQKLIIDNLEKIGYEKDEYKASCYLLQSDDEKVKSLPQYTKAHNLISGIIEYFRLHKAELMVVIQEVKDCCEKLELSKKYYDILSQPNPFVENVDEFKMILNSYDLTDEDKINILTYIINNNIIGYEVRNK